MAKHSVMRAAQFQLRFSEEMHERLKAAATANSRSINTEILHRLEASFSLDHEIAPAIRAALEQEIDRQVSARLKAIATNLGAAR